MMSQNRGVALFASEADGFDMHNEVAMKRDTLARQKAKNLSLGNSIIRCEQRFSRIFIIIYLYLLWMIVTF